MCPMDVLGIFMHTSYKYHMIYDSIYFSIYLIYNYIYYIYIYIHMKFQYFSIPSDFWIHQAPHLLFPSLLLRNVQHHIRGRGDRDGQHLVMQSWRDLWEKSPLKTWLQSMDFSENLGDKPEKISPHVFIIMPFKLAKMRGHAPFSDKTIC